MPRIPSVLLPGLFLVALAGVAPAHGADVAPQTQRVDRDGACTALAGTPLRAPTGLRTSYGQDVDNVPIASQVIVSPTRVDVERGLRPGDSFSCEVVIRNRRDTRTTFDLRSVGLVGGTDGGVRFVSVDESARAGATAATWIDPVDSVVQLDPRQTARVPVTVTVPPEPPVGAAYGAVQVVPRVRAPAGAGGANLGVEQRIAVGFLLRVGGEGRARLELRDVQAPRLRWSRASWTWRAQLRNSGTVHARPAGQVRVRSIFGGTVAQLGLSSPTLLPGARTKLTTRWRGVPWFGFYRYEAKVRAGTPDGRAATHRGWFMALPPWWVLALMAMLLVAAIVLLVRRRREDWRGYLDEDDEDDVDAGSTGADARASR